MQHPCQRDLGVRRVLLRRKRRDDLQHRLIRFYILLRELRHPVAHVVYLFKLRVCGDLSGKEAARYRGKRYDANAMLEAERENIRLTVALKHVVQVLHRRDRRDRVRLCERFRRYLRHAPAADQPLLNQPPHYLCDRLEGNAAVDAVQVVQVYVIGLQILHRALEMAAHGAVQRLPALHFLRPHVQLCGEDDLLSKIGDGLSDKLLVVAGVKYLAPIRFRRIKKGAYALRIASRLYASSGTLP